MIYFKKLRWRNFLSTGNQFIEIDLAKSQSTLIIGTNGSGKSTMLDALCFVLFNRPFRDIKKEQLVNTINQQDCELEVEFETSNKKYILNLVYLCRFFNLEEVADFWYQIVLINDWQQKRIYEVIVGKLFGNINGKIITILGFS